MVRSLPLALCVSLLSLSPLSAADLSGSYHLRAVAGLRAAKVELTLQSSGPDRYRATRTVRRRGREVTHTGEAIWNDGRLRLRLDMRAGATGALSGTRGESYHGTYRVAGRWIAGRVRAPFPDGRVRTSRELGRRGRHEAGTGGDAQPPAVARGPRSPVALGGRLRVVGRQLRDPTGRAVLLRGVNVGLKQAPFLAEHTDDDVAGLVDRTGIDYVRYYVAWRAVEPEPLRYDEAYLAGVVEGVRRWTRAGVYVCVDMHQDVWGGPFSGHGAPEWASLGELEGGLRLPDGLPWQARYVERRVWSQFEALWSNQTVPSTGLGLQDHYARAWVEIARRLRDEDLVVGYDPMNEPFMGREVKRGLTRALLGSSGTLLGSSAAAGLGSLFSSRSFGDELQRRLLRRLRGPRVFDRTIRRLEPAGERFERRLARFYGRVGRAIQAADPGRPIFVEPWALAGIGVPSHLPHPGLDQIVYAPHLYDSFMDSGFPYDGDARRVEQAFRRHLAVAHRLGVPLVVGEWGNLPGDEGAVEYAQDVGRLFDRHGIGAAYWDHAPGSEATPQFLAAMRPYVQRTAGDLVTSGYDAATRTLRAELRCDAGVASPSVLVAPPHAYPNGAEVRLDGVAAESEVDAERGLVYVWARGAGRLTVEVAPR